MKLRGLDDRVEREVWDDALDAKLGGLSRIRKLVLLK